VMEKSPCPSPILLALLLPTSPRNPRRRSLLSRTNLVGSHSHVALFHLDVNDVWTAADRTILDVLLALSRGEVDGHDDCFAVRIAIAAVLVVQRCRSHAYCNSLCRKQSTT